MRPMTRLLLIAVFFEIGIVLLVAPWTAHWERNYFADEFPLLQAVLANEFVRGAISGLGLVNLYSGFAELISLILANRSETPPSVVARTGPSED